MKNRIFIEYSEEKDAVFCFFCRHFEPRSGNTDPTFVKNGYSNWKKIGEKLLKHAESECHKLSVTKWNSFLSAEQSGTVVSMLSDQHKTDIVRNRSAVATLARVALVCARQGIALRGHRETIDENYSERNKGNF